MNKPFNFEDKLNRASVFNYREDPIYKKLLADKTLNNIVHKRSNSSNYIKKTRRAVKVVERPDSVNTDIHFTRRYELQKELGKGSYGEVYMA